MSKETNRPISLAHLAGGGFRRGELLVVSALTNANKRKVFEVEVIVQNQPTVLVK